MENKSPKTQHDNCAGFSRSKIPSDYIRTYAITDTGPGKFPVITKIWHPAIDIQSTVASYWLSGFWLSGGVR